MLPLILLLTVSAPAPAPAHPLAFIDNHFENGSSLHWEIDEQGAVQIFLVYDQERSSTNRANGHWHFQLQAQPGADLTLVLNNFENVWNGKKGSPATERTISVISLDGKKWQPIRGKKLEGNRLQYQVHMDQDVLWVARLEPYRLSDLEAFEKSIAGNSLVEITTIGHTVENRPLEMIRVGRPDAPHRLLLRARAHAWEPGGNWVVQGLIERLLKGDDEARQYLDRYCVYVMPMANKDGVVRGRTRFNLLGKDINRNWDQPADRRYCPENVAIEEWIERAIRDGRKPDLMIDFHNDDGGRLHVSRPEGVTDEYLGRMKLLEELLRKHTWFTEGSTGSNFHNPGSIGEGLYVRYGITACVHELNANWIAGLNDFPTADNWKLYGRQLCRVFYEYFAAK